MMCSSTKQVFSAIFHPTRKFSKWISAAGPAAALKQAIEVQIMATPQLVGGEISVVQLSRSGVISWVERGECRELNAK